MLGRVVTVLGIFAVLNFVVFVLVAMNIGGDAVNGQEVGGRYFLADHGQLTEVSRSIFLYSTWHVVSVWLTLGAFTVTAGVYYLARWLRERRAR